MKTKILTVIIGCLVLVAACKKDGNLYKIMGMDSSQLQSSESSVVLTKATSTAKVLALTWKRSELSPSDTSVGLPTSVPKENIEASASSDFSNVIKITPTDVTFAFTGLSLNTLGKNLGFTSGVSTPMYFRISSGLGINTTPFYSNVVTVNITCYSLDMTIASIYTAPFAKRADSGFKLYAPKSDGEYHGFTSAAAWSNWFLLEDDGTYWGNVGADGKEFNLSNDTSSFWNFWYPGQGGCYYTTVSTTNKEWTATYIPALTVSGDVAGTMTFDKAAVKWYVSFTTTADNKTLTVKCDNASLYNKTTSTVDLSAVAKTLGFIPNADSTLSIDWSSASAGNITISKAGDYTLTFYLANPKAWTYQLKSGKTVVVKPLSKKLYLPGIGDGSGSWTFKNYLTLISETDSTYDGVINVDSPWGYEMTLDSGEWVNVYKKGSADGTLAFKGASNIPAPTAGINLINGDLKHLTYRQVAINQIYVVGLNDVWDFTSVVLTKTSLGVYTGTATITKKSSYGIQILVEKDNWTSLFGGSFASLSYKGSNITDDQSLVLGTYAITVDLLNKTCSFVKQ
jgi:starch-binding outer membrane protein SusE/F